MMYECVIEPVTTSVSATTLQISSSLLASLVVIATVAATGL